MSSMPHAVILVQSFLDFQFSWSYVSSLRPQEPTTSGRTLETFSFHAANEDELSPPLHVLYIMSSSENSSIASPDMTSKKKYETAENFLLAIAKDARYVQQCSNLLDHILEPSSARTSRILAEYISWLFYIVLTTKRATLQRAVSTPGMDACEVQYVRKRGDPEVLRTTVCSWFSSMLFRASSSSAAVTALISVTLLYGIRWQSERIQQRVSSMNHDRYHGQERRNAYLLQRQEMILRGQEAVPGASKGSSNSATGVSSIKTDPRNVDQTIPNQRIIKRLVWGKIRSRLRAFLRAVVVALDRALPSVLTTDGPHDSVAATTTNISEVASTSDSGRFEDRLRQVFLWIFQFHLACFCMSGKYPTIFHRFIPQQVVVKDPDDHGSEPSQPKSSILPVVGAMLFCRLSYQFLFHAISQPLIHFFAAQRYLSCLQSRRSGKSMDMAAKTLSPAQSSVALVGQSPRTECAPHMACYICQQPPLYPSCLISCGHVFCWYCIQQWITDHDAKCPICRVQCSAKDVMYLYNV